MADRRAANGASTDTTKPSNPKEAFGDLKLAVSLVPDTAIHEETLAYLEGALKYGQYNWRIAGVKVSSYVRAMRRHLSKYWNGQDRDPRTRVKELASIRACCGILLDAQVCGMLNDDRPPRAPVEAHLEELAAVAKHLKELFKDHHPPQYTEREHGRSHVGVPTHFSAYVPAGTLSGIKSHRPRKKRNPTSRKMLDAIVGTRTTPPTLCFKAGCWKSKGHKGKHGHRNA